ncbi:MAG: lysophospholipid acyltransferase family protein [Verrucomicrobia bacterium]|nr:lysophospholipid acyltransferase family protein [Verrucomicrobiota bacterium]
MDRLSFIDRLRFVASAAVLLLYWVVWAATLLPLSLLLSKMAGGQRGREVGQVILKGFFGGFVGLLKALGVIECELIGFDRLKSQVGPMIIAPNHPALWDAVMVISEVDLTSCVMKASLLRNPLLFCGSTAAGFISNEPSHKMMRSCIERLRGNERLVFFPEGTRTRPENGSMNPLTGGLAVIAKNSGAPVWPIYIQTSSPYLSKGWPIWRLPRQKIRLRLTVGEPMVHGAEMDSHAFLEALRQRYIDAECGVRCAL